MSWLFFAFSGPVLWAISTHLDKYLVERFFKHSRRRVAAAVHRIHRRIDVAVHRLF